MIHLLCRASKETPHGRQFPARCIWSSNRKPFEPIRRPRPWSDRRHTHTSQLLPRNLPFARSTRPGAVRNRRLPVPLYAAHTFRQFVDRVIPRSIAFGFVARERLLPLCL